MRLTKVLLIWLLLFSWLGPTVPAQAAVDPDISYSEFKQLGTKDKAAEALFLHGIVEGFLWANAKLILDRHESPLFCQPKRLSLTSEQELSILDEYLKERPEDAGLPLGLLARLALEETFPCASAGPG